MRRGPFLTHFLVDRYYLNDIPEFKWDESTLERLERSAIAHGDRFNRKVWDVMK